MDSLKQWRKFCLSSSSLKLLKKVLQFGHTFSNEIVYNGGIHRFQRGNLQGHLPIDLTAFSSVFFKNEERGFYLGKYRMKLSRSN